MPFFPQFSNLFIPPNLPFVIPNPSILLHMNGTNGSTAFIDSSLNNFSVTANENAIISTNQYKFGGASGYFGGDGSNITVNDNAQLNFSATDDFTIEGWIYFVSIGEVSALASKGINATFGWTMYCYSGNLYFGVPYISNDIIGEFSPSINTWYFLACTRSSGAIRLFVDGIIIAEESGNTSVYSSISPLKIGVSHTNDSLDAYVDDFRITKGYAYYTSNFTPPISQFPNP